MVTFSCIHSKATHVSIVFLIGVISTTTLASEEIRFTEVSEIQKSAQAPKGLERAKNATTHILVHGDIGEKGTAIAISNNGHYLTVRHAIESSLAAFKKVKHDDTQVSISTFDRKTVGQTIYLTNDFSYIAKNEPMRVTKAKLIAAGDATLVWDLESLQDKDTVENLRALGWSELSDFAIIQIPPSKEQAGKKRPCVPTISTVLDSQEKIWSLQYPGKTARPDHNSDGLSMYFTSGHVLPNLTGSACYEKNHPNESAEQKKAMEWILAGSDAPVTSLDANAGSSGAPVFTTEGQLAGIITEINNGGKKLAQEYCPLTKVIPVAFIRQIIENQYGEELAKEVFDCKEYDLPVQGPPDPWPAL